MDAKYELSHYEKNSIERNVLAEEEESNGVGENCVMRRFIICTLLALR
jgi:hypothetical protein